jgi:hypothetical protein
VLKFALAVLKNPTAALLVPLEVLPTPNAELPLPIAALLTPQAYAPPPVAVEPLAGEQTPAKAEPLDSADPASAQPANNVARCWRRSRRDRRDLCDKVSASVVIRVAMTKPPFGPFSSTSNVNVNYCERASNRVCPLCALRPSVFQPCVTQTAHSDPPKHRSPGMAGQQNDTVLSEKNFQAGHGGIGRG